MSPTLFNIDLFICGFWLLAAVELSSSNFVEFCDSFIQYFTESYTIFLPVGHTLFWGRFGLHVPGGAEP